MNKIVLFSLLLSLSSAQLRDTRQTRSNTRGRQQSSPRNRDGFISLKELKLLGRNDYRFKIIHRIDQVPASRPSLISKCTYDNYIYDPVAHRCALTCTKAHCGNGMQFLWSSGGGYGSCACLRNECLLPCWGRPFVRRGNKCYKMATRGPCPVDQVLVPVDKLTAKCGRDACLQRKPNNAINFSKWARDLNITRGNDEQTFLFTYKNKCYMTETQAFCAPGKVVRFMDPYKSPFCVPRNFDDCSEVLGVSTSVKVQCAPGFVEDRARNLCVPEADFD